jgi:hypothetical protein
MANRGDRLFEGTFSLDILAKGSDAQNARLRIRDTQDFGTLIVKSRRILKPTKCAVDALIQEMKMYISKGHQRTAYEHFKG